MRMTPLDIQHQKFRKTAFGYDPKQVDEFLSNVQTEWEFLYQELHQNEEEITLLETILGEHRGRETALNEAMVFAQKMSETVKEQSQKEADQLIAEATKQSDQILRQAYDRLAKVIEDIREAKRIKLEFHSKFRSMIEAHAKLLELQSREHEERNIEHVAYLTRG